MKKKQFSVPADLMADFAGKLDEFDLDNEIKGTTDDGDISVIVHYNSDQRLDVFELTEWLENLEYDDVEDEQVN